MISFHFISSLKYVETSVKKKQRKHVFYLIRRKVSEFLTVVNLSCVGYRKKIKESGSGNNTNTLSDQ